jgi:putative tryptophan/tyrosine transport system substrate-binding protein
MRRREFIAGLGAAAWPVVVRAQQRDDVPKVGYLDTLEVDDPEGQRERETFAQALARAGWTADRIFIDFRSAGGEDARIRQVSTELLVDRPRVILVRGTQASIIVKAQTTNVPIVFTNVADPVGNGLVTSLSHPGENVTGFASVEFSLGGKWLGLLKQIAPDLKRVLFLYSRDNPNWHGYLSSITAAAQVVSVRVNATAVARPEDFASALETFSRLGGGGGVINAPSALLAVHRDQVAASAIQYRLPTIFPYRYYAVSGGLLSYGSDGIDLYRQAAAYVDRILRGERTTNLPVQMPTKLLLVANLKTAKALGLTIPETLLATADEVIQ